MSQCALERLRDSKKNVLDAKHLPYPKASARVGLGPMQRRQPWSIATTRSASPASSRAGCHAARAAAGRTEAFGIFSNTVELANKYRSALATTHSKFG